MDGVEPSLWHVLGVYSQQLDRKFPRMAVLETAAASMKERWGERTFPHHSNKQTPTSTRGAEAPLSQGV